MASKLAEWHKPAPEFPVLYFALSEDNVLSWYLHSKLSGKLEKLGGMVAWGQATFT